MKVLLVDADGVNGFPNLALMKISAAQKQIGNQVDLLKGIPESPPLEHYDFAYASCIFFQNRERLLEYMQSLGCSHDVGGSGIDMQKELPHDVEHIMPDYSLYHIDFSVGYTSRGCIRRCEFCVVPEKEGGIRDNAPISEFHHASHEKIVLLDNNFLASPQWHANLMYIQQHDLRVNFNQGIDIRLVTEDNARALADTKIRDWGFTRRAIHFAFDSLNPSGERILRQGIGYLSNAGIKTHDMMCYVLVGFDTSGEEDMERIRILKELGVIPFVMIYNRNEDHSLHALARWVNRKYYQFLPFDQYQWV